MYRKKLNMNWEDFDIEEEDDDKRTILIVENGDNFFTGFFRYNKKYPLKYKFALKNNPYEYLLELFTQLKYH